MSNTLTDTEKVKMVFEESNLKQKEFADLLGITGGSLSGIFSGRTNPTLAILKSIRQQFPNINPEWLFGEDPNMHIGDTSLSTAIGDNNNTLDAFDFSNPDNSFSAFGELGRSAAMGAAHTINKSSDSIEVQTGVSQNTSKVGTSNKRTIETSSSSPNFNSVSTNSGIHKDMPPRATAMPVVDTELLATTIVSKLQKPVRKITEIRIFFDDGTYETFGSNM